MTARLDCHAPRFPSDDTWAVLEVSGVICYYPLRQCPRGFFWDGLRGNRRKYGVFFKSLRGVQRHILELGGRVIAGQSSKIPMVSDPTKRRLVPD